MGTIEKDRVLQMRGEDLYHSDGDRIGSIEEIYVDQKTGAPECALVSTGMFGGNRFVPLRDASETGGSLRVPYDKAQVKDAPKPDADGDISEREEADLYRRYGLGSREPASGRDISGPTTDDAMTRSEEELSVGTTERESGRGRLRKYVVTDEVTKTVPVKREEVRVEREPITDADADAVDGPAISEEEHEIVLHDEEVVAEKRVVPRERVRLDNEVEVDERTVSDDVRREEIDVDDGGTRADRA